MAAKPIDSRTVVRRQSKRLPVKCRARIRIGNREYAGFVENISAGGARIRTVSPIRSSGPVYLTVPDLPPMRGQLRWIEPHGAGVSFYLELPSARLQQWARTRLEKS